MDYEGNIMKFSLKGGFEIDEAEDLYSICINELKNETEALTKIDGVLNTEFALKVLHNIKGVAGSYYIDDVYQSSIKFYDELKSGQKDEYEKKAKELYNSVILAERIIMNTFLAIKQTIK